MDEEKSHQPEEDEMERKLRSIEERAKAGRVVFNKTKTVVEDDRKSTGSSYKGLGLGLMLAYGLIGFPIACYGLGWLIDRQVGGTLASALLTVFGMVCAVIWVVIISARHQS